MAANYQNLTVRQTVRLLGGTQLEDVYEASMETLPSLIFAVFRNPISLIAPDLVALDADQLAVELEGVAAHPNVATVAYRQDVTLAGVLRDLYDIYVTSTSGLSSTIVTIRHQDLGDPRAPLVFPRIDAAWNTLNAIEAS